MAPLEVCWGCVSFRIKIINIQKKEYHHNSKQCKADEMEFLVAGIEATCLAQHDLILSSQWHLLAHDSVSFIPPASALALSAMPGIFIREARCCLLITSWPRVPSLFLLSNDQPPECKLWPCSCPLGWPGFSHHWKGKLHESTRCSVPRVPKLLPLEAMSVISVKIAGKRTDFYFFKNTWVVLFNATFVNTALSPNHTKDAIMITMTMKF